MSADQKARQTESRSGAQKALETIAAERCPCGHLKQRHRKPAAEFEVMGVCRDCDCRGLMDFGDWNEDKS